MAPAFDGNHKSRQKRCQHDQWNLDRHKQEIKVDRHSPEGRARHLVVIELIGEEITGMDQQFLAHVHVQVLPNLWQQNRGVSNQKRHGHRYIEDQRRFTAGLAGRTRSHSNVMMVKRVQTKKVWKIFGGHHQSERSTGKQIVFIPNFGVSSVSLLRP